MKETKGQFGRRKNVWTVSKNAYEKGLSYAYRDRRNKKRNFRALWMIHEKNIDINRKTLADLAMNNPDAFKAIVEKIK